MTFTLSVDCATEDWDSAAGEMRLIYSDATATTIRQDVLHTAEYLASQPWTPFSLTTTAPAGTTQLKVEFATWGAREAWPTSLAGATEAMDWTGGRWARQKTTTPTAIPKLTPKARNQPRLPQSGR